MPPRVREQKQTLIQRHHARRNRERKTQGPSRQVMMILVFVGCVVVFAGWWMTLDVNLQSQVPAQDALWNTITTSTTELRKDLGRSGERVEQMKQQVAEMQRAIEEAQPNTSASSTPPDVDSSTSTSFTR